MSSFLLNNRDFYPEFEFLTSRSSGAGGQNINKVNTKVELRFRITNSQLLTNDEKELLRTRYPNKINDNDELMIVSQVERSQLKNKERVVARFYQLLQTALTPKEERKPTKPTKASVTKRLDEKKKLSAKKTVRKYRDEELE